VPWWLIFRVIRNIIFDRSGTLVDDLAAVPSDLSFVLLPAGREENMRADWKRAP
jgi:hypothetical protein